MSSLLLKNLNVIHLMTAAFNDIEQYGTTDESSFAYGWMCPIYKKERKR